MEKVYTGSRLADGNKVSPAQITLKNDCVVVKEAGLNGKLITVSYSHINRVQTKTPLIGFSSIKFGYASADVIIKSTFSKKEESDAYGTTEINGLSKSEVNQIKMFIEMGGFGTDNDGINNEEDDEEDDNENKFNMSESYVPSSASKSEAQSQGTPANTSSTDGLYDAHLEKLINIALADGELTEKEKQILFKKAEAMGIDLDEFEMVLEARLYEMKRSK